MPRGTLAAKTCVTVMAAATAGAALPAAAQPIAIGATAGISIPNLSAKNDGGNPINTGYSSRFGPDFSLLAEIRISDVVSLVPMLEYSSQGGKKNGFQALTVPDGIAPLFAPGELPPYLYATFKSEAKLHYLLIPVLVKAEHPIGTTPWRVHVAFGPFAGFLLSATQVSSGQSPLYLDASGQMVLPVGPQSFDSSDDVKDSLRTLNVGIEGNLGVSYRFGRNSVFLQGGGNYGFVNIQKEAVNGENGTGAATVVLGYTRWLGK